MQRPGDIAVVPAVADVLHQHRAGNAVRVHQLQQHLRTRFRPRQAGWILRPMERSCPGVQTCTCVSMIRMSISAHVIRRNLIHSSGSRHSSMGRRVMTWRQNETSGRSMLSTRSRGRGIEKCPQCPSQGQLEAKFGGSRHKVGQFGELYCVTLASPRLHHGAQLLKSAPGCPRHRLRPGVMPPPPHRHGLPARSTPARRHPPAPSPTD